MIGFFPGSYPEELFYSICARYSKRVKYRNKKDVAEDLFGNGNVSSIIDFPSHLDELISRLPLSHYSSSDKIIHESTLLSFFEPFIPSDRIEVIRKEMKGTGGKKVSVRIGVRVKQIQPLIYLRYCPDCAIEDRKLYGETYWHRLPQLAGINVCPEHQCFFANTSVKFGRESSLSFILADDFIKILEPQYINTEVKTHRIFLKMAEDAKWLLSQNNLTPGLETIRKRYYNALLKKGFAHYGGRIKNSKFIRAFENYFPSDLLNSFRSTKNNWITQLLLSGNTEKTFHPISHILLMTFLDLSAEEFFLNFEEYKPFGESSYPCLNPASDHFGEPLIKDSVVLIGFNKVERSRDLPLGVFSCHCGFIYQRFGPDKCEEDKFKYNSVREYGTVWENKLSKSWQNSNYTIKKIAEELRTTSSMVVRHAIRLGLTEKFPNARQIEGYADHRNPRKTFSELLSKHRKEWLSVLMNNPDATRQKLIDKAGSQYAWLRRNDSAWLEENLPPVYKSPRKRGHLNWEKIDLELCKQIKQIVMEIRKEENPIARVSITEIIRRVGKKIWIEKREEKLPLTAKLIDENLESFEDFMIRKIRHTKTLYLEEKKVPTRLQFCVRAVIRNKVSVESKRVQKEIDDSIEILKKLNPN